MSETIESSAAEELPQRLFLDLRTIYFDRGDGPYFPRTWLTNDKEESLISFTRISPATSAEGEEQAAQKAREVIVRFVNTISEGEGDYSCNECELDTYLCPHLFERLQGMFAQVLVEHCKGR